MRIGLFLYPAWILLTFPAWGRALSDNSPTSEEYIRLGMPAPDRDWSADDMTQAVKVLESLAKNQPEQLPRYHDPRSGEMFARLTSPQNLEQFKQGSIGIQARLPQAISFFKVTNRVFQLYVTALAKKQVRDSEIIEVWGVELRASVVMLDLADELLPTIKKDDPKYEKRMQGIQQMRRGLALVVAGTMQALNERESARASELKRLVGYMQETFPRMVPRLPALSRQETLLRLEQMQKDPKLKDLQPGLAELYAKTKASTDKSRDRSVP